MPPLRVGLVGDMEALARACGLAYTEVPHLLTMGVHAGYIVRGSAGGVGLTRLGWRWHRWDQHHRPTKSVLSGKGDGDCTIGLWYRCRVRSRWGSSLLFLPLSPFRILGCFPAAWPRSWRASSPRTSYPCDCRSQLPLPTALLLEARAALPPLAPRPLALFVIAGLLATGVGSALATQATRLLGAARIAAIRLLDPFFAFVIAALFLHESVAPRALLGVAALALALLLLQLDARRGVATTGGRDQAWGIALAIGSSLAFTTGSVVRKAG